MAVAGLASAANAAGVTTYDTSLPNPPGVFFGTGNFNDGYAVTTDGALSIGLKSKITGDPNDTITPVGDDYSIALGKNVSFDYAVIPGSTTQLANATATLTILDVGTGQTFSFDPSPATVTDDKTSNGAYENSEQLAFFPADGFSLTQNGTYDVTLTLTGVQGIDGAVSVEDVITYGSGAVPEPASWALMILGLGGVGGALRRNRKSAIAPAIA